VVSKKRLDDLYEAAKKAPAGDLILDASVDVVDLLIRKNISYGNSALYPNGIFAKGDAVEQLSARLDDKLNRVKNNESFENEGMLDAVDDIIGYLVLLKIAVQNKQK
jgi:hypothetical protein